MEEYLDDIDRLILHHLSRDARTPLLEIARQSGISNAAIHQRFKRLEKTGIINGSRFNINHQALGYEVCAFVGITLDYMHNRKKVIEMIQKIPYVVECHLITGNYTMLLKILCRDNDHLIEILNTAFEHIPGIAKMESFISLDQTVNREIVINKP